MNRAEEEMNVEDLWLKWFLQINSSEFISDKYHGLVQLPPRPSLSSPQKSERSLGGGDEAGQQTSVSALTAPSRAWSVCSRAAAQAKSLRSCCTMLLPLPQPRSTEPRTFTESNFTFVDWDTFMILWLCENLSRLCKSLMCFYGSWHLK